MAGAAVRRVPQWCLKGWVPNEGVEWVGTEARDEENLPIVLSELGGTAGVTGASALAPERMLQVPRVG